MLFPSEEGYFRIKNESYKVLRQKSAQSVHDTSKKRVSKIHHSSYHQQCLHNDVVFWLQFLIILSEIMNCPPTTVELFVGANLCSAIPASIAYISVIPDFTVRTTLNQIAIRNKNRNQWPVRAILES